MSMADPGKKPNQGKNAANKGDKLKHPLICETLFRCFFDGKWPSITYAETHAGAGVYSSEDQKKDGNIVSLRRQFEQAKPGTPTDSYFLLLDEFWEKHKRPTDGETKYPGSAMLATLAFRSMLHTTPTFTPQLRLTENGDSAFQTLKLSLASVNTDGFTRFSFDDDTCIRNAGFQDNIDWLTGKEDRLTGKEVNLVLVIDPFRLSLGTDAINTGGIDLFHLVQLLEQCKNRTAVIGFWYATDQLSNGLGLPAFFQQTIIENYFSEGTRNVRLFRSGKYEFIWIGFKNGIRVVESLPTAKEMNERWFAPKIYERFYLTTALARLKECFQRCTGGGKEEGLYLVEGLLHNMSRLQGEL
jgi:hypothetical protein